MYEKLSSWAFLAVVALLAAPASSSAAHVYTFEGLTNGAALSGQDNWTDLFSSSGSTVETGTGVNTTSVVSKGTGISFHVLAREDDGNFNFHSLVATDTAVVYRFDARSSDVAGTSRALMGFGSSGAGRPSFGFNNGDFYVRADNPSTTYTAAIGSAFGNDDWVRFQLSIDLTANSGDGSGSLAYQNLTNGDAGFTNVVGMQNLNTEIFSDVTMWDTVSVDLRGSAATVQADNLQVEVSAIPEPSSLILSGLGLLAMAAIQKRRQR